MKVKSPLRYPGGKSRALKFLMANLPDEITEYRDPFVGGGSMALAMSERYPDLPVWINDKYEPLFHFWHVLRDHAPDLTQKLLYVKGQCKTEADARGLFESCRELVDENLDPFTTAWAFWVCNKCSFSGLSSGFSAAASQSNFSVSGIERLVEFSKRMQHWKITNLPYQQCFHGDADPLDSAFIFLDPPYDINSFLYGKKGGMHSDFCHITFSDHANYLFERCNVMITYNSNDRLKSAYSVWNLTEWDLTYTLHSSKTYRADESNRKELLITNYCSQGIEAFS